MAKPNMTGFASKAELEKHTKKAGAFLLGEIHPDHGYKADAAIKDDRHIFMVAGSRAGKGTTMIIPNLIDWPGGVFCIDPKGENASITAMRRGVQPQGKTGTAVRHFLGQKVAILDPYGTVRGPARKYCINYDPLSDIAIGSDEEADQIQTIAEAIVVAEQGSGTHFSDSAETLLAGIIEAVLHHYKDPACHTLAFCRAVFQDGTKKLMELLKIAPATPARLAKDAFAILEDAGEEESGSFSTTLSRQLRWIADPRMQAHLRNDGFSLVTAMRENSSVYVCLPPSRIPRMKRWLRVILRVALDAKMSSPFEHKGHQTLFLLDEFSALGHFQIIEDAAAYMAGYGIKLVPVIQNVGQVVKLYEKNWETFLGNAGGIIAWGLNDLETEKYVSDRLGQIRDFERSYGASTSRDAHGVTAKGMSDSTNIGLRERAIRWPNEIHQEGAREHLRAFIIPAAGAPFTVRRVEYMARDGQGLFDSPDHISEWEKRFAERTKTPR